MIAIGRVVKRQDPEGCNSKRPEHAGHSPVFKLSFSSLTLPSAGGAPLPAQADVRNRHHVSLRGRGGGSGAPATRIVRGRQRGAVPVTGTAVRSRVSTSSASFVVGHLVNRRDGSLRRPSSSSERESSVPVLPGKRVEQESSDRRTLTLTSSVAGQLEEHFA